MADLERAVAALRGELATVTNRDLPLLKGTIRVMSDAHIESVEDLPDAGRELSEAIAEYEERLTALEDRFAMLEDVGSAASSKEEKFAAILAFAENKQGGNSKVAVTPQEIKGCTGVSRRYAYELVEAMGEAITGVRVREPESMESGSGRSRKEKALLVDCELLHTAEQPVNSFTTDG